MVGPMDLRTESGADRGSAGDSLIEEARHAMEETKIYFVVYPPQNTIKCN